MMAYVLDGQDYFYASSNQIRLQKEAQYTDAGGKLAELCECERIHRRNLTYLESLAAKYGMDTPLRVVNELQAERAGLAKVRGQIVQLETALEDSSSSKEITEHELAAATEQLEGKGVQAEIHERNIAYLEELTAKYGEIVPLSLHNAIREEAEQLVLVRQCIAKIDHFMLELTSWLDQTPQRVQPYQWDKPLSPLGLPLQSPTRRWHHQHLMDAIYRDDEGSRYGPHILGIIGQCAFDNDICLHVDALGQPSCVVSKGAVYERDSELEATRTEPVVCFDTAVPVYPGLVEPGFNILLDDQESQSRQAVAAKTAASPESFVLEDSLSFFEQFGDIFLTHEIKHHSPNPVSWDQLDELDPWTDWTFISTSQMIAGIPTRPVSSPTSTMRLPQTLTGKLRSWLRLFSKPGKRNRKHRNKRKEYNE